MTPASRDPRQPDATRSSSSRAPRSGSGDDGRAARSGGLADGGAGCAAQELARRGPGAGGRARRLRLRSRVGALASLLGDPSPTVWSTVRSELEDAGAAALPTLRRAARSDAADVRARARTILATIDRRAALRRLVRYACRETIDLERALLILGRHHTPRLDPRPYLRALDAMALEVSRRAHMKTRELDRARTLVDYLGEELELGGSVGEFHHPDNIHLHRAIERRAGMPLTLCAIYQSVARRSGLKVAILPLPGHVMLRLFGDGESLIVDPYHHGRTRSQRDCLEYLAEHGLAFEAEWFQGASDRALFRRQVLNLTRSTQKRGLKEEARELTNLVFVLGRSAARPSARWT